MIWKWYLINNNIIYIFIIQKLKNISWVTSTDGLISNTSIDIIKIRNFFLGTSDFVGHVGILLPTQISSIRSNKAPIGLIGSNSSDLLIISWLSKQFRNSKLHRSGIYFLRRWRRHFRKHFYKFKNLASISRSYWCSTSGPSWWAIGTFCTEWVHRSLSSRTILKIKLSELPKNQLS